MMPTPPDPRWRRVRRRAIGVVIAGTLGLALLAAHRPLLSGFALLFRVDDPAPSEALVVLLGGMNCRPSKAAELYRQGLAPVVLMGTSPEQEVTGFNETRNTRQILRGLGVPVEAIRVLPGLVTSTREEAIRVREYAAAHRVRRITVVTTAFHTARSRWVFRKVLRGTGIDVRMASAREPAFDESDWYRSDEGLVQYFSEAIKTLYYWIVY